MALEPITRKEKIIAGQDLTPITRMEMFLKEFGGGGSGGGGGWFVVTASVDESGNIIVDHYRDDIAVAFENGKMPIVKSTGYGETVIFHLDKITNTFALFSNVSLAVNPEDPVFLLQQVNISKDHVSVQNFIPPKPN